MIDRFSERAAACIDALEFEEWFPGLKASRGLLCIDEGCGVVTSIRPDESPPEDIAALFMGGALSMLWDRWMNRNDRPRFGYQDGEYHISVFPDTDNDPNDCGGQFPRHWSGGASDLETVLLAVELELGLRDDTRGIGGAA